MRSSEACLSPGIDPRSARCSGALVLALALVLAQAVLAVPITIDYAGDGWTDEFKMAGDAAAGTWSKLTGQTSYADESVTVRAFWTPDVGLAATNSSLIINFMEQDPAGVNPYLSGFWYPTALANHLARKDLSPDAPDMAIGFSTKRAWHTELDHRQDGFKYDFYTVMLHEIAHGLGFYSLFIENGDYEPLGGLPNHEPSIYDVFLGVPGPDGGTDLIVHMEQDDRSNAIVSDAVEWTGIYAGALMELRAPDGSRPAILSPDNFELGRSLVHLDPDKHPDVLRPLLMGPFYDGPRLVPSLGELGMLLDMGWLYPADNPIDYAKTARLIPVPPPVFLLISAIAWHCIATNRRRKRT